VELPPITEDDRRVAADAADMVLPKQRLATADIEYPPEPFSESPLAEPPTPEAAGRADDGDSELVIPEGAVCPMSHG